MAHSEAEIRKAQEAVTTQVKAAQAALELAKEIATTYGLSFDFGFWGDIPNNTDAKNWYSSSAHC